MSAPNSLAPHAQDGARASGEQSSVPDGQPVRLDLWRFFAGRDDYAVIRLGDRFPDYEDYSDVDVLCADTVAFLRHVLTVGAAYERQGFTIKVTASGRQLHVDFHAPGAKRLTFRFDLFDTFDFYDAFAVAPAYPRHVLARKRVVRRDGSTIFVPDRDDDLALRLLEYVQFRATRPDKIKHLRFVEQAGGTSFLERIARYTDLAVAATEGPQGLTLRIDGRNGAVPHADAGDDEAAPFYRLSPTCQVPRLASYYERVFGQRRNGCFVEVGAFDGEYVSNTSGLADAGWTGHYVEPVPRFAARCRERHARNRVTVTNAAVCATRGRVTMHVAGALSTASERMKSHFLTLDWAKREFRASETVEVDCITLNDLLETQGVSPGFELLVIDVEGGEWSVLQGCDLDRWRPEMVIIELHDENPDYVPVHDQCRRIVAHFEQHRYVSIYKDRTNTVYVARERLEARERLDLFVIWGHGLERCGDVVARIRDRRDLSILAVHRRAVDDIAEFVRALYGSDTVPFEHLRNKTRYLLATPPEVVAIVVRNLNPQERIFGDGPYRHIQCALVKDVKEEIRDAWNPRHGERRSEDHVVHATDYESQTGHALALLGLPPMAHYRRSPHRDFDLPYHLEPFDRYRVIQVPLDSLRARVAGEGAVPLAASPHYQYVASNTAPYEEYHRRHVGGLLTDDHFPAAFTRLIETFDAARACNPDSRAPIVVRRCGDAYEIHDGLHRAAILLHRGIPSAPVLEILPGGEVESEAADVAVLIFSKDRPLQLDATLRSFKARCQDAGGVAVHVLFTASTLRHDTNYRTLASEHPDVRFTRESRFKPDVLRLVRGARHTLLAVDDALFVRDFRLRDIICELESQPDAIGFSLRLGLNTTWCYSFDRPQALPAHRSSGASVMAFDWRGAEHDFGYPLEVSSSVYRTGELLPLLEELDFHNPNTLEAALAARAAALSDRLPVLLSYTRSAAFCAPLNRVQSEFPNRASGAESTTAATLAGVFEEGRRIDVAAYAGFTPAACHQEITLTFSATTLPPARLDAAEPGRVHRVRRGALWLRRPRWQEECKHEIAFWENYLRTGGGTRSDEFSFRTNPDTNLQEHVAQTLEPTGDGRAAHVLDVGAGPLTILGKRLAGRTMRLTAVDPLADAYNAILDRLGIVPVVRTQACAGEALLERFALNEFDVVHARNAIDHSCDAPRAVDQMLAVTRPGGCVVLEHGIAEGRANGYAGLHSWNFLVENDDFIIESATGARVNVTERYAGVASVTCATDAARRWISVRIDKHGPSSFTVETPLVSVIIPCYGQAHYLPEAVRSVVAQSFQDFEIIVVDDGGGDDTYIVARQLAARYEGHHISVLSQPNGGLGRARNAGIRAARGKYILPLDADDRLAPEYLERTVRLLEERPAVRIAATWRYDFGAVERLTRVLPYTLPELLQSNRINYCSLYRRDMWEEIGGYRVDMMPPGYEDWNFWIDCAERGWYAEVLPEPLFQYRVAAASMITQATAYDAQLRAQIVLNHPRLFSAAQKLDAERVLSGAAPAPAPPPNPATQTARAQAQIEAHVKARRAVEHELASAFAGHLRLFARAGGELLLWGTGAGARRAAALLASLDIPFAGFVERDAAKQGTILGGQPVFSLDRLGVAPRPRVIVASSFAAEILGTLRALGYEEGVDALSVPATVLASLADPAQAPQS